MPGSPVDPASIRFGLERQLALIGPIAEHLRGVLASPSPLNVDDWLGPAAEAADRMRAELTTRLSQAEQTVDDVVRELRLNIALLS